MRPRANFLQFSNRSLKVFFHSLAVRREGFQANLQGNQIVVPAGAFSRPLRFRGDRQPIGPLETLLLSRHGDLLDRLAGNRDLPAQARPLGPIGLGNRGRLLKVCQIDSKRREIEAVGPDDDSRPRRAGRDAGRSGSRR